MVIHALEVIHEEDHEDSQADDHSAVQAAIHEEDHEDALVDDHSAVHKVDAAEVVAQVNSLMYQNTLIRIL